MAKPKQRTVRTIADFVKAMGGTGATAEWAGVTDGYVSNMLSRGYLPGGFHMRAYVELKRRGFEPSPELFDLQPDDGEFLVKIERARPLARRRRTEPRAAA